MTSANLLDKFDQFALGRMLRYQTKRRHILSIPCKLAECPILKCCSPPNNLLTFTEVQGHLEDNCFPSVSLTLIFSVNTIVAKVGVPRDDAGNGGSCTWHGRRNAPAL